MGFINKIKSKKGVSLAELMLVVALILILGGMATVNVVSHQRDLRLKEMDNAAKEIFFAAQNRLTAELRNGTLDRLQTISDESPQDNVYYLVHSRGNMPSSGSLWEYMLPFGSVDETLRTGGSYIILYNYNPAANTAYVLNVWYSDNNKTGFWHFDGHEFKSADYPGVEDTKGDSPQAKDIRKHYNNTNQVIGWYGRDVENLAPETVEGDFELVNEEVLFARVTNVTYSDPVINLVIRGENGTRCTLTYSPSQNPDRVKKYGDTYIFILDDITDPDLRFSKLTDDDGITKFTPGENITVTAFLTAYDSFATYNEIGNAKTNSLYASVTNKRDQLGKEYSESGNTLDDTAETAEIRFVRHLENLSNAVSGVDLSDLGITNAEQTQDLYWKPDPDDPDKTAFVGYSEHGAALSGTVYYNDGSGVKWTDDSYYPVDMGTTLTYDGTGHTINNLTVNVARSAGVFGDVTANLTIQNLGLLNKDDSITSTNGTAGGLVGVSTGTLNIVNSFSTSLVSGVNIAGGLVGSSVNGVITASYVGGHTITSNGQPVYDTDKNNCNVRASGENGVAGGLIGSAGDLTCQYSYSTASVSGSTAGGFGGSVTEGSIKDCYAVGLVVDTTPDTTPSGAFLGVVGEETALHLEGNRYFESINTYGEDGAMPAVGSGSGNGITPAEESFTSYNNFVVNDSEKKLEAYNVVLNTWFENRYYLPTVSTLAPSGNNYMNIHHGDYQPIETLVENRPNP